MATGVTKWIIVVTVVLGTLLEVIDSSIVNVALTQMMSNESLPTLAVALHANPLGVNQARADDLVAKTRQTCLYSGATRGNSHVQLTVTTTAEVPGL